MAWLDDFWKKLWQNPLWFTNPSNVVSTMNETNNKTEVDSALKNAQEDPTAALGTIAQNGNQLTPEQEKYLDTLIENQKTQANNDFQEHMRDTSLLSTGNQLEQLGLSSSGVLSSPIAASGVQSAAAGHPTTNIALDRYHQRLGMAKSLLGLTSQMASAGVYGHALAAARKASGVLSSATAHSGYAALKISRSQARAAKRARDRLIAESEEYDDY